MIPQNIKKGVGSCWSWDIDTLTAALYERTFTIPADWQGSEIILKLARVSTEATIYVNNNKYGKVTWPSGEVVITSQEIFNQKNTLQIFVSANDIQNYPLSDPIRHGRINTSIYEAKGLIGDVILAKRPNEPHISDVFVQTSVREKTIKVDVELTGVLQPGEFIITDSIFDKSNGQIAITFSKRFTIFQNILHPNDPIPPHYKTSVFHLVSQWTDGEVNLWDLDNPNLYTSLVTVKGAGLDDEYAQDFGFREFWIDGQNFFLNGKIIHLRPNEAIEKNNRIGGARVSIDSMYKAMRYFHFNQKNSS